jgi:glycosyltransferase involved in cell wall biosynthesis
VRIAFVAESGIDSTLPFSGIPYFMARALRAEAERFYFVKTPSFDLELMFSSPRRGRSQLQQIGRSVSDRLQRLEVDCVICQGSSMLPFLESKAFVCLWHDSTWQTLLQIPFDEFRGSYPLLHEWDQLVLEKSTLIAYAAEWVRDETIRHYSVALDKLVVVPFGASVFDPADEVVEHSVAARERSPCQLTFIGVDWIRKGLPLAHSLMKRLNLAGVPAVLNVVGPSFDLASPTRGGLAHRRPAFCSPFSSRDLFSLRVHTDECVRAWGFLNKDVRSQYLQFCRILRGTHFLVHPAEFECFGVALAEANAFGVPVLSLDRCGPRSIIKSGLNGHLFEPDRFVAEASALIAPRLDTYEVYRRECRAAFDEYKNRLNWRTNCRRLLTLIADAI